jgi:hypothetical protein
MEEWAGKMRRAKDRSTLKKGTAVEKAVTQKEKEEEEEKPKKPAIKSDSSV